MKMIIALSALLIAFSSCKKDDNKNTPSTVIKYTIQPIDEHIIDVRYNNKNEDLVIEDVSA